ncbi:MAG: hypothetical protein GXO85_02210 [Chlorobi bacterium]|nr:hypothetical protein [Chlorobiota bacterium]
MMEKVVDVLINNGIAGVVILILFYGLYKTVTSVLNAFLASVKAQSEANIKFAKNITDFSKEIEHLTTTNVELLDRISTQIEVSKNEIISHIKKKL